MKSNLIWESCLISVQHLYELQRVYEDEIIVIARRIDDDLTTDFFESYFTFNRSLSDLCKNGTAFGPAEISYSHSNWINDNIVKIGRVGQIALSLNTAIVTSIGKAPFSTTLTKKWQNLSHKLWVNSHLGENTEPVFSEANVPTEAEFGWCSSHNKESVKCILTALVPILISFKNKFKISHFAQAFVQRDNQLLAYTA